MSTPDQPQTPQLTRRQLRELRNTAATPIITPEAAAAAKAAASAAPLPRPAAPTQVRDAPVLEPVLASGTRDVDTEAGTAPTDAPASHVPPAADAAVTPSPATPESPAAEAAAASPAAMPGTPALTRRARRQQERLRTASIPVVAVDATADEPVTVRADGTDAAADATVEAQPIEPAPVAAGGRDAASEEPVDAVLVADGGDAASEPAVEIEEANADDADADDAHPDDAALTHPPAAAGSARGLAFGADLLAGPPAGPEDTPSFDQILDREISSTGSLSIPSALILSQTPETGALVAPITATGEVLVTGTLELPGDFAATGRTAGVTDGKEADAALLDGELPAASSPMPVAASSAISTIKSAEEIIQPPAPEKNSRLMMALAITAGVLAVAIAGVLIAVVASGAFQ